MTKANDKELEALLDRMSVQSILDMKENFKEVSYRALDKLNKDCVISFGFYGLDVLCGCCFIFDAKDIALLRVFLINIYPLKYRDDL